MYPYVVHGVNLRIECEKGDVTPPQDFKSLHFLIAGGEGCASLHRRRVSTQYISLWRAVRAGLSGLFWKVR